MRTLKTSRRELEHVAVCVTGEVSAEFIRDIQETMRRENQRRRDAGRPGMSYTVSGGEGSPEECKCRPHHSPAQREDEQPIRRSRTIRFRCFTRCLP